MNVYTVYRLFLLGFTLYGLYQFTKELLKYKPYYDRVPNWIKKYILRSAKKISSPLASASGKFILKKLAEPEHRKDLIINGILLIILIILNGITLVYY